MTKETKAWIEEMKKKLSILDSSRWTWKDHNALVMAIDIIESQEKEIERLKEALKYYATVECKEEYDWPDQDIARKALEAK